MKYQQINKSITTRPSLTFLYLGMILLDQRI